MIKIIRRITRMIPIRIARAHCDIPCGIYDPISAKIAAQTVLKMVMRINALSYPNSGSSEETATYNNSLSRYIAVKEQHADLVKQEIDILWHDYFKPEHLEKYPTLHTIIWEAAKLSSTNKQSVDLKSATELVEAVDNIAEIFWATKGINYNDTVADTRFGT